jgi:uncharacterized RDD family membrane protein YckC
MNGSTYVLADHGPRIISAVIDGILTGIITGILTGVGRETGGIISFLVGMAFYWYFWSRQEGRTPGKQVMKLKVIKVDGTPISDSDAIIRYFGYFINTAIILLGWLWILVDKEHQGWHDKIAKTYVVVA